MVITSTARSHLTLRGVAVLVITAVLVIAGVLLGNPLLRALGGFGLGTMLVAALPALGRLRPEITRNIHPNRVERGQPAMAQLEVRNTTHRRQPGFVVRDRIGDQVHEVAVRALPAGGSATYHYELPTARRGRMAVGPIDVERSDLLGLVRSRTSIGLTGELRVYPRRHRVRASAGGRPRHHFEGPPPRQPMRGSMDLRVLREYVPGDELRHLHWKASARTGRLMVREYVDPAQPHCLVLLDTVALPGSEEAFEQAVEVAAALLWEACERDQPARLVTTTGLDIAVAGGARSVRELMDPLCDVTTSPGPAVELDPARLGGSPSGGWFVYVTASPQEAAPPVLAVLQRSFSPFTVVMIGGSAAGWPGRVLTGTDATAVLNAWNAVEAR